MTESSDNAPLETPDETPGEPTASAVPPPYQAPAADASSATPEVIEPLAPLATVGNPPTGPVGQVRGTGACILLTIVTLGFYTWYWYFKTSEEMKEHSGEGVGGGIALVLAIFVGFVMPFVSSNEVGKLYQRRGQQAPVTAMTGLWFILLGWFFLVGCLVWFVKTNGALNEYWRSLGQTEG